MKIIRVSNFDKESVDDLLVSDNANERYTADIVQFLNTVFSGDESDYYFKKVEDDYVLHKFEP